ncbi:trypsin-like serine peptidase [Nonomuraea polychroma]|uniref:trypsin-like serine peptidase n=1 Tax=Nonomuraea polychroma TaxID=46176 RepID=UPI003D94EFD2
MDFRQMLADPAVTEEFLDRFDELADSASTRIGGLEGLGKGQRVDRARAAVQSMLEGTWESQDPGLEAIIERFTRPVYLVQDGRFAPSPDGFPECSVIATTFEAARARLEPAITGTGRVDLRNHRKVWVGTGWLVAPTVVVTARHVAEEFAERDGKGFAFRLNYEHRRVSACIDWRAEHHRSTESRFLVEEVLWMEPSSSFADVALLRIASTGEQGETLPGHLGLMSSKEITSAGVGAWIAVIGYPNRDSRYHDVEDQQRIFDGIYNVKRLAPGQISAIVGDKLLHYDATTLGGNSGSAVVDLSTGKAAALHFGGVRGQRNVGVLAPVVHRIVDKHAGGG